MQYRFDFDHKAKTISVVETNFGSHLTPTYDVIAQFEYIDEENHCGIRKLWGNTISTEVYNTMATAFFTWRDINRGFFWKSTFEQRLNE